MQVLQTPLTWIIAAGVLLVLAVVLLALGHHRRGRADRDVTGEAAATGPVATPAGGASRTGGPRAGGSVAPRSPDTGGQPVLDAGPSAGSPSAVATGAGGREAGAPVRSRYVPAPQAEHDPVPQAGTHRTAETGPDVAPQAEQDTVQDGRAVGAGPSPSSVPDAAGRHRVEHRLLSVVVRDPDEAVRALAGLEDGEPLGRAAGRLLRAGLTPAQVARLCGVAPADLASAVATDLGLLPAADRRGRASSTAAAGGAAGRGSDARPGDDRDGHPPRPAVDAHLDGGQDGTSRTVEPGRAWANTGSAAASTTPTTG